MMIFTFCSRIAFMRAMVCAGEGGMPGLGSTKPTTSRPKWSAKFDHER